MTLLFRNHTVAGAVCIALLSTQTAIADSPPAEAGAPLTAGQLTAEFQHLSPDARAALLKQLRASGSDMSPEQMKSSFNSLPPELQSQLQAKWDGLSDAQRAALKKMSPGAIKQIFLKDFQPMLDKGKDMAQTARAYVQKFLGKFFGSGNS